MLYESDFPRLIGNKKLKSTVSADIRSGKAAHAYIIDGIKGSGKHTAAREICAAAVCEHRTDSNIPIPCGHCPSCRKILSGISVDVMTVSNGEKATIGVDAIRGIRSSLYVTPNDGEKKFYIIENAHLMTPQAQNALLLSLEEPPPYVMFLLLSEDTSALLDTIKSRAPSIRTERFSPEFVLDYLMKHSKNADREKAVNAAFLSDGSLGKAAELMKSGTAELKLYNLAAELSNALLSPKKSDGMILLSSMPKDRQSVCRVLSLTRFALRDAISSKKGGSLLFYPKDSGVPDNTKKISVKRLIELSSALTDAENDIAANCSANTVLTSIILNSQKGEYSKWKTI